MLAAMPRLRAQLLALLAALAAVAGPAVRPAAQPARELRVAAVQFGLSAADLASREAFRGHVQRLVERCLAHRPDLILFPEYTSAFLALLPYGGCIREAATVEEAFREVRAREPQAGSLRALLLLNAELAERSARELFGSLARRYRVAIGAGTYFASAGLAGEPPRLVNRAVVFDARGRLLHVQDKAFLTPFEQEALGVEPGRLEEAATFLLKGRRIGLTICRDTFFAEWERVLAGAELWVDLQANGEPYTAEVRERFQLALPARLQGGNVPYGLSVCLTGELLELMGEGESFLAQQAGGVVRVVERAAAADAETILLVTVPAGR
jgi:predicted amidohydrolase